MSHQQEKKRKIAIAAAFVTLCVVWSSTWVAIKIGLKDLPPISFAGLRFLIAFLILVAVSIGRVPLLPRGDSLRRLPACASSVCSLSRVALASVRWSAALLFRQSLKPFAD